MGFDGVEILHRQMESEDNVTLQESNARVRERPRAVGFSTHQGFLSPKEETRKKNVDHTIHCIELAYALGIPTMRVNTGTWGTSKNFDELMKNRGIEPPLKGYTDDDGFNWVIDSFSRSSRRPRSAASSWAWKTTGASAARRRACCRSSRTSTRRGCR